MALLPVYSFGMERVFILGRKTTHPNFEHCGIQTCVTGFEQGKKHVADNRPLPGSNRGKNNHSRIEQGTHYVRHIGNFLPWKPHYVRHIVFPRGNKETGITHYVRHIGNFLPWCFPGDSRGDWDKSLCAAHRQLSALVFPRGQSWRLG
jgi:hypothetical protein